MFCFPYPIKVSQCSCFYDLFLKCVDVQCFCSFSPCMSTGVPREGSTVAYFEASVVGRLSQLFNLCITLLLRICLLVITLFQTRLLIFIYLFHSMLWFYRVQYICVYLSISVPLWYKEISVFLPLPLTHIPHWAVDLICKLYSQLYNLVVCIERSVSSLQLSLDCSSGKKKRAWAECSVGGNRNQSKYLGGHCQYQLKPLKTLWPSNWTSIGFIFKK